MDDYYTVIFKKIDALNRENFELKATLENLTIVQRKAEWEAAENGQKFLEANVVGWSDPETRALMAKEAVACLMEFGFSRQEAENMVDYRAIMLVFALIAERDGNAQA